MTLLDGVIIRPFQPQDQEEARKLILSGLKERWGSLDEDKNPDLDHIPDSYREGVFLVAVWEGAIVGTGALIPETAASGRIVRMSTRRDLRCRGIGGAILERLTAVAKASGYQNLVLETTAGWEDAVQYYHNRGFRSLGTKGDDHHFEIEIANHAEN